MAYQRNKSAGAKAVEQETPEPIYEEEPTTEEEAFEDATFVCIQRCYFGSMLWRVDDETSYIPGIEKHCDPEKPDYWFSKL